MKGPERTLKGHGKDIERSLKGLERTLQWPLALAKKVLAKKVLVEKALVKKVIAKKPESCDNDALNSCALQESWNETRGDPRTSLDPR